MLLAGSTRPSMKLYRFFVSFVKYVIYNIFSKVRDVVHPVYTRKGVEEIIKKTLWIQLFFISLHKPRTELTFFLSHVVILFFIISTLRGEIDIILEVLVVCLISWLGMVIGPLWHYDIGLIVLFLLSSWEFMVNCIVFFKGSDLYHSFYLELGVDFIEIYW